ncbi:MAG TPA: PilZ domain-containing protein [Vicinamibacteria bacterium]
MPPSERRRDPRLGLSVPVRVTGHDADGTQWEEMTATEDASFGGASFPLKHPHGVGQVLLLSLPLPRNFRRYDLAETSYRTYALVRNTRAPGARSGLAGVLFLGRVPPKGFAESPGGRFRLPQDSKAGPAEERRREERLQLFVNLRLLRRGGGRTLEEQTVTENVSRGGARVYTTLPVVRGEGLLVSDLAGTVSTEAVVRNVFVGSDRVTRLNLQFRNGVEFRRLLQAAGAPPLPEGGAS